VLTSDPGTWVVPYRMAGADFQAQADAQTRVHDAETGTGGSAGGPVDVVLLPDKSRVELGLDPDRRWHLEGPSTGGGDSDNLFGGLGGDFAAGARSRVSSGTRFVLYQRNIENHCQDRATLGEDPEVGGRALRRGSRVPRDDRNQGCARATRRGGKRPTGRGRIALRPSQSLPSPGVLHVLGRVWTRVRGASPRARTTAAGPASTPGHPFPVGALLERQEDGRLTADPGRAAGDWPTNYDSYVADLYGFCGGDNRACAWQYRWDMAALDAQTRGVQSPGSYRWWFDIETINSSEPSAEHPRRLRRHGLLFPPHRHYRRHLLFYAQAMELGRGNHSACEPAVPPAGLDTGRQDARASRCGRGTMTGTPGPQFPESLVLKDLS
jgi:hypothetical protein